MTKRELNQYIRSTAHRLLELTGIDDASSAIPIIRSVEQGLEYIRSEFEVENRFHD